MSIGENYVGKLPPMRSNISRLTRGTSSGGLKWQTWQTFAIPKSRLSCLKSGGREGIRTPGLLVANEALSQLSYSPTSSKSILAKAQMLANTRSTACRHLGAQHLSRLGREAPPLTPKTYSASGSYGCSTGPPARWATIFLAFWYSARAW